MPRYRTLVEQFYSTSSSQAKMTIKTLQMLSLMALFFCSSLAFAGSCDNPSNDFDGVYCLTKNYLAADAQLNDAYSELRSRLTDAQKQDLKIGQIRWITERNTTCSATRNGRFFIELDLATQSTLTRLAYLKNELQKHPKPGGASAPSPSDARKPLAAPPLKRPRPYRVSKFSATYFNENTLVSSETVSQPSINYKRDSFCKIHSGNFQAAWEANIDALEKCVLPISHSTSTNGSISVFIDDILAAERLDSNGTLSLPIYAGKHRLRIEFINNSYETHFNASLINYPHVSNSDDVQWLISKAIKPSKVNAIISGGTTQDLYNNVHVALPDEGPVFLVLESQKAINWIFSNQSEVKVSGVLIRCKEDASTITGIREDTPIYNVGSLDESTYQEMLPETFDYTYKETNLVRASFSY